MNILHDPIVVSLKSIIISKDAYRYLEEVQRLQRGCRKISHDGFERMWSKVTKTKDGKAIVYEGSFGGGDGTYNGRWWDWNCDMMKEILSSARFTFEDGPSRESVLL